jgi:hypothetical protein
MSGTLRIIVVALVVALITAGSSTAAFVVTSKNIKNGTIRMVDLSPAVKQAIRATPEPPKPQVIMEFKIGGGDREVTAHCPAGTQLIGGGFDTTHGTVVLISQPDPSGANNWHVRAEGSNGFLDLLRAYALCVQN